MKEHGKILVFFILVPNVTWLDFGISKLNLCFSVGTLLVTRSLNRLKTIY